MGKRVFRNGLYRTELRDPKPMDIVLMYIFFFLGGTVGTFLLLLYLMFRMEGTAEDLLALNQYLGPMGKHTYSSTLIVSLLGGFLSIGYLMLMQAADPYQKKRKITSDKTSQSKE